MGANGIVEKIQLVEDVAWAFRTLSPGYRRKERPRGMSHRPDFGASFKESRDSGDSLAVDDGGMLVGGPFGEDPRHHRRWEWADQTPRSAGSFHDFGDIVAEGQELGHVFALENQGERGFGVDDFTVAMPCCSAMMIRRGEKVAPGGTLQIPVRLTVGNETEIKRADFFVRTDGANEGVRRFTVTATCHAKWEFRIEGDKAPVPGGETRRLLGTAVARRMKGAGAGLSWEVFAQSPLKLVSVGEPVAEPSGEGIEVYRRSVEIELSPADPGVHRGVMEFGWGGEGKATNSFLWSVAAPLSSKPRAFVLDRQGDPTADFSVVITSDGRDFRVEEVEPSRYVLSRRIVPVRKGVVRLSLELDARRATAEGLAAITLRTDHPAAPALTSPVVHLPGRRSE